MEGQIYFEDEDAVKWAAKAGASELHFGSFNEFRNLEFWIWWLKGAIPQAWEWGGS
jgi:hypothetical protein